MKKVCRSIACSAALLTLLVPPSASAQDMAAAQAKLQARMEEAQKVASIEADKEGFVGELLARFASTAAEKGYDAFVSKGTKKLLRKSARDLQRLSENAKDFDTFYKLVFEGYTIDSFGQLTQDLVFFPISACRIYDSRTATRVGLQGPMAPGTQRSVSVNDSHPRSGRGQPLVRDRIPDLINDPPALAITLTAASPSGPGNLRTFAAGAPVPNAAMLTYTAGTTISTGAVTSSAGGVSSELTVRNQGAGNTDVVIDIVGYFHAPVAQPLACQTVSSRNTILANSFGAFDSPACPAGTDLTGGGVDTNFSRRRDLGYGLSPNTGRHAWTCSARSSVRGPTGLFDLLRRLLQHSGPLTYRQAQVRSVAGPRPLRAGPFFDAAMAVP